MKEPQRGDYPDGASGLQKYRIAWAKWDRTSGNLAIRKQNELIKELEQDVVNYGGSVKTYEAQLKTKGLSLVDRNRITSYLKASKYNLSESQKKLNKIQPINKSSPWRDVSLGLENSTEYSLDLDANDAFNPFETNSEEQPNFGFERVREPLFNTEEKIEAYTKKKRKVEYDKPKDDEPNDDTSSTAAVESNDTKNEVTNKEQLKSTAIPKPWARKWAGGDGRSLSDVNDETEAALEARGFNMNSNKSRLLFSKRGYSKNQLLADVRTGRATLDKDRLFANGQVLKIGE